MFYLVISRKSYLGHLLNENSREVIPIKGKKAGEGYVVIWNLDK